MNFAILHVSFSLFCFGCWFVSLFSLGFNRCPMFFMDVYCFRVFYNDVRNCPFPYW